MTFDDIDDKYVALQRKVLFEQGQHWDLNIHGWNAQNESVIPICEWQGVSCDPLRSDVVVGLHLESLNIAGPLSPDLGLLSCLVDINLSKNYISGQLPEELSTLPNLKKVRLNHNRISGRIPLFTSHKIVEFNVSHNVFDGMDYFNIDFHRDKVVEYQLDSFDASNNALRGPIGDGVAVMNKLSVLDLGYNKLYGTIPQNIGDLKQLNILKLNRNRIVGTIPPSFTRSDLKLVDVDLSDNDLSGTIPIGISNIRYLKNFKVTGNKLTGVVPSSLCNLRLNEDLFNGDEKPEDDSQDSIRDGCNSVACPTNHASKTGVYPCTKCGDQGFEWYLGHVGRCLYLNEKVLLDEIYDSTNGPMWTEGTGWTLDHVDKCAYSGVECNGSGHVVAINLTDHGLSGTIPQEFGMFRYLESVDLSNNRLTGYLPSDFRFLPLEHLDVSGNKLEGNVPPMLCLTGDINGNGKYGDFNCDTIACPSGTWSPIGRASPYEGSEGGTKQEYSCQPCKKSLTFLGSKICGGAIMFDSDREPIHGMMQLGSREFITILTVPLLGACLIVLCTTSIFYRFGRRSSIDSDTDQDSPNSNVESRSKKGPESKRTDLLGTTPSTRSAMDFNYGPDEDNDGDSDGDVHLKDIGTGLPYRKDLHRMESLQSLKIHQIDDDLSYAHSASQASVGRSSFMESSVGKSSSIVESSNNEEVELDDTSQVASSSVASNRSSKSKRSRGTSSRLSQAAELWLDVPEK